jgi:hypothetical protein
MWIVKAHALANGLTRAAAADARPPIVFRVSRRILAAPFGPLRRRERLQGISLGDRLRSWQRTDRRAIIAPDFMTVWPEVPPSRPCMVVLRLPQQAAETVSKARSEAILSLPIAGQGDRRGWSDLMRAVASKLWQFPIQQKRIALPRPVISRVF